MTGQNSQDLRKPEMNYHTATDEIIKESGGQGPKCPYCGGTMFPEDDHGRFTCRCQLLGGGRRRNR